jgi:hypothetical protein
VKQLPTLVALIAANLLALPAQQQSGENPATDPAPARPIVEIKTTKGAIKIELYSDLTPGTVDNFLKYVDAKFYDDTIFHRVIRGFVVQGGGSRSSRWRPRRR